MANLFTQLTQLTVSHRFSPFLTVSHPQKNLCLGAVAQAASAHRTNRNSKPNPHSKKPMKTRKNPFRTLTAASLLATVLASAPALQAATFTWTGAGANTSWAPASGNWNPSPAVFDATADLIFDTVTNGSMFLGYGRQANSLSFGAAIDSAVGVSFNANDANAYVLTMSPNGLVNPSVNVDADATGNITLGFLTGVGTNLGRLALAANLDVVHNGSGILNFNREISGTGFGITKTGTGTMMFNSVGTSANSFTGDVNINEGRLIANGFAVGTDINKAANVNLGGGALEVRNISGANKDYTLVGLNVTSASTLAYQNTGATSFSLTFSGANAFDLDADLTVQNISPTTTLTNPIFITRSVTGLENMIVKTYNNITSSTSNFLLGRVALGGGNSGWSGALDVREGTAEIFGAATSMDDYTGSIRIGETGNSFGAGLLFSPTANANITFSNPITVRTGGFRTIRSGVGAFSAGGDTFYTLSGPMTLEGNLNLHVNSNNSDRRIVVSGNISGAGGLELTRGNNGFFRLSGDNKDWSGDLKIVRGTAEVRGNAVNSAGTGLITIGATGDTTAATLAFVPEGTGGTSVSYANNIVVNPGGPRNLNGGNTNHNITLTGNVTLDGDLTVNHSFSTSDRRINLNGSIAGSGGLTITRTGTSTETTLRMAGAKSYLGGTTVSDTASLALAGDCILSSNVLVQAGGRIGGPGTINTNLTLENTAKFYFYAIGISPASYVPMKVNGTVTLDSSFSAADIVGGSRGEAVPWGTYEDGTYTLISNTASTFNTISNFGPANAAHDIAGSGKTVYFQNGGGTDGGGLQIVVTTAVSDPYTAWSGGAAFDDDANKDGIENGLAFLLGAENVNDEASSLLPVAAQSGGSLTITFSMLDAAARGDAALQVQHSSDLGISDPWSTLVTVPDTSDTVDGINFTVTAGTPPLNNVTAIIPASGNAAGGKLFGRLKANP
jgi:autotransporter-associated beta strand protein